MSYLPYNLHTDLVDNLQGNYNLHIDAFDNPRDLVANASSRPAAPPVLCVAAALVQPSVTVLGVASTAVVVGVAAVGKLVEIK